jgi:hypothetical protein
MKTENPTMARNRRYTEAFRDGLRAAGAGVPRDIANMLARNKSVADGDAFLAGYYAELRRLRMDSDGASL